MDKQQNVKAIELEDINIERQKSIRFRNEGQRTPKREEPTVLCNEHYSEVK